jgi:hypothetical protein
MTIIYPIDFPSVGGIESVEISPVDRVAMTKSEFTEQQLVVGHEGQSWNLLIQSVFLRRSIAEEWIAFLLSLKGTRGTFAFGDPFNTIPRGVATGTPLIKGATETGEDINTDGWTPSTTGIVKKGDWVQVDTGQNRKLFKSLTDADSDVSGNALLTLWPSVKVAFPDNTAITMTSPKGIWRLPVNDRPWTVTPRGLYKFAFSAIEAQ